MPYTSRTPLRDVRRAFSYVLGTLLVGWSMTACDQAPTAPSSSDSDDDARARGVGGRVAILVDGLPATQSAEVVISGPAGFRRKLIASDTLTGLATGRYSVQATPVTGNGGTLVPELSAQYVDITPSSPMATVRATFRSRLRRSTVWVEVSGLPQGAPASIQLTNPEGGVTSFSDGGSIETSASGEWTLNAAPVQFAGHTYSPSPAVQRRTVRNSDVVTFSVGHFVTTGALAVAVTGLPAGQSPNISITGPGGFQQGVSATTTFTNLQPGSYTITAAPLTVNGLNYAVSPANRSVTVDTGVVAAAVTLNYAAAAAPTGSLQLTVSGLPAGSAGAVQLSGPNGFSRTLTTSGTVPDLVPGAYTIQPQRVRTPSGWFDGGTASTVTVPSGGSVAGTATYAPRPAAVSVTVTGLPSGVPAAVTLTNPSGVTSPVPSTTWIPATAGRWIASAATVRTGGFSYLPSPAAYDETVLAGDTLRFPVSYALGTGAIAVSIAGLPAATAGAVTVTGPNGFSQSVTATQTLTDLAPGNYTVAAATVVAGGITFSPSPATRTVTVTASLVAQAAPVAYASQAGSLAVTLAGLPSGAAGDVLVSGPNGYSQTVTATTTLTGLGVGSYTLAARPVRTAQGSFGGAVAPASVTITAGGTATATATYSALPAVVEVPVTGLPGGATAAITLTAPSNAASTVTGSTTISPAAAGRWRLSALTATSGGHSYTPAPASYDQTVLAGDTLRFPVTYSLATGAIAVSVSGLPTGTNGSVTITGPNSFSQTVTTTSTLTNLTPGSYTVTASPVTAAGVSYAPTPATRTVTVTPSLVAQAAAVTYSAQVGQLALTLGGLPSGSAGDVLVTGPNGYSQTVTATGTLSNLLGGSYTIAPRTVRTPSGSFGATASPATVTVSAGATASAAITYSALPSVVIVSSTGLPSGTNAALTLTAPSNAATTHTGNHTVSPAASGRWRLTAADVASGGHTYTPAPASYDQTVLAGDTLRFPVTYALSTGAIAVSISGLPTGTNGSVTVTGPNAFSQVVTATSTLTNLAPGSYTVTAATVTRNGISFTSSPTTRTVTVTASLVAQGATVAYTGQFGRLTTAATGLPAGATPTFSLTGAATRTITGLVTTDSLPSGAYTLTANAVTANGVTFTPTPSSSAVSITTGGTATSSFTYTAPGGGGGGGGSGLNVLIENAYVTQAVQNWAGSAQVVAGRAALLRVFVRAGASNTARPEVRARIFENGAQIATYTIPAPGSSVPTTITEGTLNSSWNVQIPASEVRAGMRISVEVDPANTLGESDRSDNIWPRGGTLQSVNAITAPTLNLRLVPVTVQGATGDVTESNREQYLQMLRQVWPLRDVVATVRAPFTSSAAALQSSDGNGAWLTVLSEMNALRTADGAPSTTHYYGVLRAPYTSGVAGYGYQPGRSAIGWDRFPSANWVLAHELGHNFSLGHAPCGTAGVPSYPYTGGVIGVWGWNATSNTLVAPTATDVMGYCGNQWISDFNWGRVANFRATSGMVTQAAVTDGLLVWGRGGAGGYVVEPAFPVRTRLTATPNNPTHEVEVYDEQGSLLASHPLVMESIDHADTERNEQFATVIPMDPTRRERASRIVVRSLRSPMALASIEAAMPLARLGTAGGQMGSPESTAARVEAVDGRQRRLTFDDRSYRMAMVRDRDSGEILAFVRRSGGSFEAGNRRLEVVLSNGTRAPRAMF